MVETGSRWPWRAWALASGTVVGVLAAAFLGWSGPAAWALAVAVSLVAATLGTWIATPGRGALAAAAALVGAAVAAAAAGGPLVVWKQAADAWVSFSGRPTPGSAADVAVVAGLVAWAGGRLGRGGPHVAALGPAVAATLAFWAAGGPGAAVAVWVLVPAWLVARTWGAGPLRRVVAVAAVAVAAPAAALAASLPVSYVPATADAVDAWMRRHIPWVDRLEGARLGYTTWATFGARMTSPNDMPVEYLGGPFVPTSIPVLSMWANVPLGGPDTLYLRGAVRDVYDGRSWRLASRSSPADDVTNPDTLGAVVRIRIRTLSSGDRVLFAPLYSRVERLSDSRVLRPAPGHTLVPDRPLDRDMTYQLLSFVPWPWPGATNPPAGLSYGFAADPFGPRLSVDDLADDVRLPPNLPDRVRALAARVTEGRATTFGKAFAVMAYLQRYTYAQDPPLPARGHDFVDDFLFVSKRGYCTSFASAMVVMLRAVGVPARYVEGYRVPLAGAVDTPDGKHVVVREGQAHAWVEVYDVALGAWLTFDPTPAAPLDRNAGVAAGGAGGTSSSGDESQLELEEKRSRTQRVSPPAESSEPVPAPSGTQAALPAWARWGAVVADDPPRTATLAGLSAAILLAAAAGARLAALRHRWLRRAGAAGWAGVYALTSAALKALGYARRPSQSPLAFLRAVGRDEHDVAGDLERLGRAYEAHRYGRRRGDAPEAEVQRAAQALWRVLRPVLRRRLGPVRLWAIEAATAARASAARGSPVSETAGRRLREGEGA